MLGEVNLPYKEQVKYFGGPDGNELNMQFSEPVEGRFRTAPRPASTAPSAGSTSRVARPIGGPPWGPRSSWS